MGEEEVVDFARKRREREEEEEEEEEVSHPSTYPPAH